MKLKAVFEYFCEVQVRKYKKPDTGNYLKRKLQTFQQNTTSRKAFESNCMDIIAVGPIPM